MPQVLLANVVEAVASVLSALLTLYFWILIGAVIVSWVNADARNPIVRFLYAATEPLLYQIRRRFPFVVAGGFDLSPIVVFLAITVVRIVVVNSLFDLAVQLRMHAV